MSEGERLERIKRSPNYRNNSFQNITHTPALTEGYGYFEVMYEFFFKKNPNRKPKKDIPFVKTDLHKLNINDDVLIWFGHSSYYMQVDGKKICVDPVFSGNASPVRGTNKSFNGSNTYQVDDLPDLDYLLITHDHYDHLDHATILKLKNRFKKLACGLGVGSHLVHWGIDENKITETDWNDKTVLDDGFELITLSARHFSGRGLTRNKSLWCSFLLQTPSMKIYIGGDSGYDQHFTEIGNQYGPIDIAILENGQYDAKWKYIHMFPEELLQASIDLKAKKVFPVHSGKFAMSNHAWDEPLIKLTELNQDKKLDLITPMIGELVYLKNNNQKFSEWWKG